MSIDKKTLERLYAKYNRRSFVHPDPLEFLYRYEDPADREIVGLVASSLAFGRVEQIGKSVEDALGRIPEPAAFLGRASEKTLRRACAGFRHRWATGDDLAALLYGTKKVIDRLGCLQECFVRGMRHDDPNVMPGLNAFVLELSPKGGPLLPLPSRGSACKRLNLFLRWMVRRDKVDPGGWDCVRPSQLLVPLDTHMHRIGRAFGMTNRKQGNLRTALEITSAFALLCPEDPVKYDFALTRLGIRRELNLSDLQ